MEWMPLVKPDGEETRIDLELHAVAKGRTANAQGFLYVRRLSSLDEAHLVFGEKVIGLSYFREI